jgi:hypothetical protein
MRVKNSKADSASPSGAQNLKFERADWTSFRTVEGLQQKAGVAQNKLIRLVLKELADNGLDTGTAVRVGEIDGGYFIEAPAPTACRRRTWCSTEWDRDGMRFGQDNQGDRWTTSRWRDTTITTVEPPPERQ